MLDRLDALVEAWPRLAWILILVLVVVLVAALLGYLPLLAGGEGVTSGGDQLMGQGYFAEGYQRLNSKNAIAESMAAAPAKMPAHSALLNERNRSLMRELGCRAPSTLPGSESAHTWAADAVDNNGVFVDEREEMTNAAGRANDNTLSAIMQGL